MKRQRNVPLICLFFCFFSSYTISQTWNSSHLGVRLSLLVSIGSHQSSCGFSIQTFAAIPNAQLNVGSTFRYFGNNLGNRSNFGEFRSSLGLVLRAGKSTNPINFDWDGALHQSASPYSLGYSYLFYWDRIGTAQRSGTWNIGIQRIDLQFENDVFGGQAKDRFRTGNLVVSYRNHLQKVSLGVQLWTGETRNSIWDKTPRDRCPNGCRDLTPLPFGKLNHGIVCIEAKQLTDFDQRAGVRLGIDSEQIRHIAQNRISHDLILFPKSIQRNTPHYPRLNEKGENVFSRKDIRPDLLYYQVFLNDGLLY